MISAQFAVTIDNIRTAKTTADATRGYTTETVNGETRGIFNWKTKESTDYTGYVDGILKEKWASGFQRSYDARRTGGVASIGGGTLSVDNTHSLYIWLEDNGINLIGSRIRLKELGTTETILYTGVISGINHNDSTIKLQYEDTGKYRNAYLSSKINTDSNNIYPILFGEVEKAKFVNTVSENEEYDFANGKALWQCTDSNPDTGRVGLVINVKPSIDITSNEILTTFTDKINEGKIFIKCVAGDGSDTIRQVEAVGGLGDPVINTISVTMVQSIEVDDGTPEWTDKDATSGETSYLRFYEVQYIDSIDLWDSCKGFQDNLLYSYIENEYVTLPNNEDFITGDNTLTLVAPIVEDFGKVSGFLVTPFDEITADTAPTDINSLIPSPSGTWYKMSAPSNLYSSATETLVRTPTANLSYLSDGSYSTDYEDQVCGNADTPTASLLLLRCKKDTLISDEIYVGMGFFFRAENLTLGLDRWFFTGSIIDCIAENNFESGSISEQPVDIGSDATVDQTYVYNFKDDYLTGYIPPTDLDNNRAFYTYNEDARGILPDSSYTNGYKLLKIDTSLAWYDTTNLDFWLGIKLQLLETSSISNETDSFYSLGQLQLIQKINDIDITKGLYAKYWGREFSTSEFGTGSTDLMTRNYDIFNHIIRLQNYDQDKLLAPTAGWGLDYIATESDYSNVLDNSSTVYGGLNYKDYDYIECANEILTYTEASTKKLKSSLCRESWCISAVDGEGKEKVYPMEKAFDERITRTTITYNNITDNTITISDRTATDIFCTPFVQYNKNYADGKYQDRIEINNVEQDTFDSSYVVGCSSSASAENMWNKAKALYTRYQIINETPEALTKLDWIKNESDAITYLNNWLEWQGGTEEGFIDRREMTLTVPYEFAVSNSFDIGSLVLIELPFIDNTKQMRGIVTKVNYNLDIKNPTCKLGVFVELKNIEDQAKIQLENGAYLLQENGKYILL